MMLKNKNRNYASLRLSKVAVLTQTQGKPNTRPDLQFFAYGITPQVSKLDIIYMQQRLVLLKLFKISFLINNQISVKDTFSNGSSDLSMNLKHTSTLALQKNFFPFIYVISLLYSPIASNKSS